MFHNGLWHPAGLAEGRKSYFPMVCGTQDGRQKAGARILRWFVVPKKAKIMPWGGPEKSP